MSTALVILNYNDAERTISLAEAAYSYACLDRIVLVDNHSTDGSAGLLEDFAASRSDKACLLALSKNGGYAKGNNRGIRHAIRQYGADHIFLANPDVFFEEETAAGMLQAMEDNPSYGVLAPLVNKGRNIWDLPGFAGILEELFLISFNLHKKIIRERLLRSRNLIETVGVAEGSFFLISREAYESAGGLDERTFLYGEEIILARRLRDKGYLIGVLPSKRYDHLHSASIKKQYQSSKARAFHHIRSSFRIYNRHYLGTSPLEDLVFEAACFLAWLERAAYDFIMNSRPK